MGWKVPARGAEMQPPSRLLRVAARALQKWPGLAMAVVSRLDAGPSLILKPDYGKVYE